MKSPLKKPTTLIIGANSSIAKALAKQAICDDISLVIISRHIDFYQRQPFNDTQLIWVENYSEHEIINAIAAIDFDKRINISQIFICHGVLHNKRCQPEKRLEDFSADAFSEIIQANTITPMLWLKHLVPKLTHKKPCTIVVFTARVGSINDNQLGGWYSYRTSKAAMNMLLKTAAVELARRAKHIKLISFHPGTTDTPLSKPFQKNVPAKKLFTPEFVAQQLLVIVKKSEHDGQVSYVDWQGKTIAW
ncbi:SDR family NAD(P)-dependent oxidoreductase [Thalassotalea sp. PLHSN55]|uniref:SDR family NAD(P)-dependent oxidoreductase n=1 Tax=Thalassotalea sp. PLHSN55 TaxID=3435888 RepID=UPI003F8491E0